MNIPRLSIIIPTFQEERYLEHIVAQFPAEIRKRCNAELIISDGGSSDNTLAVAHLSADVVVEAKCAQTIAAGRNAGARCARGEILLFFNADVTIGDPERFLERMAEAVADRSVAAATCPVLVNPGEELLADRLFHRMFNAYCRFLNLLGMGMGRGECHAMRKEVFDRLGGYNEAIVAGEDYEFFLRLRRAGKIAYLKTLVVYESPRRYRASGYFRVSMLWFLNALSVLLWKRSLSRRWTPIR
jgi:glycosyltransferase involved in cell wall biosynthesis